MERPLPDGWSPRADPVDAPGATIEPVGGPSGALGVALRIRADLAHHPSIQKGMDEVAAFVRAPGVRGVLPLVAWDREHAVFVYETGDGRLLSDLLAEAATRRLVPGERVAVELLAQLSGVLDAAVRRGAPLGVFNHGGLTPWRIVVYPDGDTALLGYALPPVEVFAWLDEETDTLPGAAFRYTPPERIQDDTEDVRSDLYSLGVVAAELALGAPLLSGTVQELVDRIVGDHAAAGVEILSEPVRTLLRGTLAASRAERRRSGADVAREARSVIRSLGGRTLGGLARGNYEERIEAATEAPSPPQLEAVGAPAPVDVDPAEQNAPTEDGVLVNPMLRVGPFALGRISIPVPRMASAQGVIDLARETTSRLRRPRLATPVPEESAYEDQTTVLATRPLLEAIGQVEPEPSLVALDPDVLDREVATVSRSRPPSGRTRSSRTSPRLDPDAPDVLRLRAVTIDLAQRQIVQPDGTRQKLSAVQIAVLAFLAARSHRDVGRDELWQGALGSEGKPESVRGVVARLRKKIERDAAHPDHLLSLSGSRFRLVLHDGVPTVGAPALPEPQAAFTGDAELTVVRAALAEAPLVSIVGVAGSGTSQLALHAARAAAADGWEVHRCPVGGAETLETTLARSLGIRRLGRDTDEIAADLASVLAQRADLLVFVDAPRPDPTIRETVGRWLDPAPSARFLVAGRGELGLPGEHTVALDPAGSASAPRIVGPAVDDAPTERVAEPDVAPEPVPEPVVPEPTDDGDTVLAAIFAELDPTERAVLQQAVVFRDGFDLAAAESVAQIDGSRRMIGVIEALCARSLLRVASGADSANVRWTVDEGVRSWVRRALPPEELERAGSRHAASYGELGLRFGGGPWVERPELGVLVRERENLRAVMQQGGAPAAGAALGLTAILGHEDPGALLEAVERIVGDPALDGPDAREWRIAAHLASARLHQHLGVPHQASAELRAIGAELGPEDTLFRVDVARLHTELGSTFEAEATLDRLVTGDPWLLAAAATLRGRSRTARADPKKAERSFVEAQHGFAALEADVGLAHAQRHFAEVLGTTGRGRRAVTLLEQSLAVFEDIGDLPNAIGCRMRLAELLVGTGHADEAGAHLEVVMENVRRTQAVGLLALARAVSGVIRTLAHDWEQAERLFFLALAGSAPQQKHIQSLFALHLLLKGDADTAHEEAEAALPDPIATALVAALERQPAPHDDEAYLLWEALEAWRAGASLVRFEAVLAERGSVPLRMVLACPRTRPKRAPHSSRA